MHEAASGAVAQGTGARPAWGWVVGGMLGLEVVMIASAYLWVFIYSVAIEPGHEHAFYEAYAKVASPIVSLVCGMPIFFAGSYWIARRVRERAVPTVVALLALYLAFDVVVIAALAQDQLYNWALWAVNTPTKIAAAWLGVRLASR